MTNKTKIYWRSLRAEWKLTKKARRIARKPFPSKFQTKSAGLGRGQRLLKGGAIIHDCPIERYFAPVIQAERGDK